MKNIHKVIEDLLKNKISIVHHADLILKAAGNPDKTTKHETPFFICAQDNIDHLCTVVVLGKPYTLTGEYNFSSKDLMSAGVFSKEFTDTNYVSSVVACATATGFPYKKINDAMVEAQAKFTALGLESGLKEYTFFKKDNKTYVGLTKRLQESITERQSVIEYFVRIAVPVY